MDQEFQLIEDEAPDELMLCSNNCGFFGASATNNLCSKCCRDSVLKQSQSASTASSNSEKEKKIEEPARVEGNLGASASAQQPVK